MIAFPETRKQAIAALEQHIMDAPKQRTALLLKPEQIDDYMTEQHRLMKILRAAGLRI